MSLFTDRVDKAIRKKHPIGSKYPAQPAIPPPPLQFDLNEDPLLVAEVLPEEKITHSPPEKHVSFPAGRTRSATTEARRTGRRQDEMDRRRSDNSPIQRSVCNRRTSRSSRSSAGTISHSSESTSPGSEHGNLRRENRGCESRDGHAASDRLSSRRKKAENNRNDSLGSDRGRRNHSESSSRRRHDRQSQSPSPRRCRDHGSRSDARRTSRAESFSSQPSARHSEESSRLWPIRPSLDLLTNAVDFRTYRLRDRSDT